MVVLKDLQIAGGLKMKIGQTVITFLHVKELHPLKEEIPMQIRVQMEITCPQGKEV